MNDPVLVLLIFLAVCCGVGMVKAIFDLLYGTIDGVNVFINRYIFKRRIVIIEGVTSAVRGDVWKSPVFVSPIRKINTAYRYPATRVGPITLNPDGTGEYCGQIVWKYL